MTLPTMTPDHESRPDERHDDLTRLNETIHGAKKAVMGWLIPMIGIAILTLVANHFEQRRMADKITEMNLQITAMNRRFEVMNEKVVAMWVGGNWHQRYQTESAKPE